jgi:hypothetical protein
MIIAVPDPDSRKKFFGTDPTLLTLPIFFKKEENQSLTSTGSGFEKNRTDPNTGYFMLAIFQNKPVFQRKFFFRSNTYCINK